MALTDVKRMPSGNFSDFWVSSKDADDCTEAEFYATGSDAFCKGYGVWPTSRNSFSNSPHQGNVRGGSHPGSYGSRRHNAHLCLAPGQFCSGNRGFAPYGDSRAPRCQRVCRRSQHDVPPSTPAQHDYRSNPVLTPNAPSHSYPRPYKEALTPPGQDILTVRTTSGQFSVADAVSSARPPRSRCLNFDSERVIRWLGITKFISQTEQTTCLCFDCCQDDPVRALQTHEQSGGGRTVVGTASTFLPRVTRPDRRAVDSATKLQASALTSNSCCLPVGQSASESQAAPLVEENLSCSADHSVQPLSEKSDIPSEIFSYPSGWMAFPLREPETPDRRDTSWWHTAYHGTTHTSIRSIIQDGHLKIPDNKTVFVREGHILNQFYIFTSPSHAYAGSAAFASPFQVPGTRGWWQVMLKVRQEPSSYIKMSETICLQRMNSRCDPIIANSALEWRSSKAYSTQPSAVLIRQVPNMMPLQHAAVAPGKPG
eukprot:GHVT01033199.1.p1 GENE.GHVT01033199.1~~GHVT01033199.1.p1  ORF type:complete len:483 (+),score=15.86 GHVT01033199.1:1119-2567(+)